MSHDREALYEIFDSGRLIQEYTAAMRGAAFCRHQLIVDAVIRRFQIIAAAVKRVPESTRNRHPQVPWDDMAHMADRLLGADEQVDWRILEKTIDRRLPELIDTVDRILDQLDSEPR